MPGTESLYANICLLDARDFPDTQALRHAAEATSDPVLMLVDAVELVDVLNWLAEKDDVCLRDSPDSLIEHRVDGLRRGLESMLDPLTRVLSRQRFDQLLCSSTLDAIEDLPVSVLLCDLDYFKSFNDKYGHTEGDEVLQLAAATLKRHCDRSGAVGRIGGEEFAVACHRDAEAAMMLADELRRQIAACQTESGVSVTVSIGIATAHAPMDGHQLMQWADQSLYSAKASGRDCCVSYDELESSCRTSGNDVDMLGLENQARVLAERVASFITMRSRKLLSTVRKEADVDGLTQCFNRRYFDRRLDSEFRDRQGQLTLAFLDLDHFGRINKQFGWQTGDKLLVEVCETIRQHLRESDWVGRYGGEEFCLVMPNTSSSDAEAILSRVRKAVEATDFTSTRGEPVSMTLSIGAANAFSSDESYLDLVERASGQALIAKRAGRNRLCIAD